MESIQQRGPPENHCMLGEYQYIDFDKDTGLTYPLSPGAGLFHVKRPHASFYSLSYANIDVDPFKQLETVTMDEGDILLVAPVKTGTRWVYEILRMLKAGSTEYLKTSKAAEWIDVLPYDKACSLFPAGSRVLNTHLPLSALPPNFRRSDTKVVATMRNMKDVITSYFNHWMQMKGQYATVGDTRDEWNAVFKYLLYSKKVPFVHHFDIYNEIWDEYQDNPNILIVRYEDLKLNTKYELKRIAEHIGVVCSEEFINNVSDAIHISNMKKGKYESEADIREWFGQDKSFYRKGEIGDWKNWFTVAQNEQFDRVYAEWNKERQIPFIWEQL